MGPGIGQTDGMLEVGVGAEALFTTEEMLNLGINDKRKRALPSTRLIQTRFIKIGARRADLGMSSEGPSIKRVRRVRIIFPIASLI